MKNRKNYLKARKKQFKWTQLGYISKDLICPICGAESLVLFDKYDAWACMSCLEWVDEACDDPRCPFCRIRPRTPYDAYHLNDVEAESSERKKRWRRDNYQHKTNGRIRHDTQRQQHHMWKESKELLETKQCMGLIE